MEEVPCVGGPLDGLVHQARTSGSLLLTHKEAGQAIVYRRRADRLVAGTIVDLDRDKAVKAALAEEHDVRAYSEESMGSWAR